MNAPQPGRARLGHRNDIDGLRGIAIILVILFHAGVPGADNGFIGVDIFFVISGFLICRGLFAEMARGDVDVLAFWGRRARRLLPSAGLVIVATVLATLVIAAPLHWKKMGQDALASAIYAENVLLTWRGTNYWTDDSFSPFKHMWSLALEEQFYFVVPLCCAFLARKRVRGWKLAAIIAGVFSISLALALGLPWSMAKFFLLHTRAWEFLAGAVVALAEARLTLISRRLGFAAVCAGLVIIGTSFFLVPPGAFWPGTATLPLILGAMLVIGGGGAPGAAPVALENGALRFVGRLSYCWYLWHWPVLKLAEARPPLEIAPIYGVVVSFVLAWLTHVVVEQPLLHSVRLKNLRYSLALAVSCMGVGCAAGVLGMWSARRALATPEMRQIARAKADRVLCPTGCGRLDAASPDKACRHGAVEGPLWIVVGDSHAAYWLPAIDEIARRRGVRVLYSGISSCHPEIVPTARNGEALFARCAEWQARLPALFAELRPALVITTSFDSPQASLVDLSGRRLDEAESLTALENGARRLMEAAAKVGAPLVRIDDVPLLPFSAHDCLALHWTEPESCSSDKAVSLGKNSAVRGARQRGLAGATIIDGAEIAFPGPAIEAIRGDMIVWNDRHHLTPAFSRTLADRLEHAMAPILADAR